MDNLNWLEYKKQEMKGIYFLYKEILKNNLLKGKNIAVYLHGTTETAIFIYYLRKLGANVYYSSCNPLSLQKYIPDYLKSIGTICYSSYGEKSEDISNNIKKIFKNKIDFIVDDGCALISYASKNNINGIICGSEQTTWGITKCKNIYKENGKTNFPIIAVNDHKTKHMFDNKIGVHSSLIGAILKELHITISGKKILICGYGSVGKGICRSLRSLGAITMVTEVDYYRALEAHYDGNVVGKKENLIKDSDIIITCTGSINIIDKDDLKLMKDNVILLNAGHSNIEINVNYIYENKNNLRDINKYIEEIIINNKKILLIAKGRVANLIMGYGNPSEIMDLTFMNQLYSIFYGLLNSSNLNINCINNLSKIFDKKISMLKLLSYGIDIDKQTKVQIEYSKKWITQI